MMTQNEFRNALCLISSIDAHELKGVAPETAAKFVANPVRVFLRADDETAAAIWAAMVARGA